MDIGSRIKRLRKAEKMTLKQLSEATDLSIGYLSNVERNISSPTMSNLIKICKALQTDIITLISSLSLQNPLVRAAERQQIFYADSPKVKLESLTQGSERLNGLCITISPGAHYGDKQRRHTDQDELAVVVAGQLEMMVEGKSYLLETGDCLYIKANSHHSYNNNSDKDCILYCFLA